MDRFKKLRAKLLCEDDDIDVYTIINERRNKFNTLFMLFNRLYNNGNKYCLLYKQATNALPDGPYLLLYPNTPRIRSTSWGRVWGVDNNSNYIRIDNRLIQAKELINFEINGNEIIISTKWGVYNVNIKVQIIEIHDMQQFSNYPSVDYNKLDDLLDVEPSLKNNLYNFFKMIMETEKVEIALTAGFMLFPALDTIKDNSVGVSTDRETHEISYSGGDINYKVYRFLDKDFLLLSAGTTHLWYLKYKIIDPKEFIK